MFREIFLRKGNRLYFAEFLDSHGAILVGIKLCIFYFTVVNLLLIVEGKCKY